MQIYVQHNGQQCGPFPVEFVRSCLANGTYQPSDLAWYEGSPGWLPLSTIPGIFNNLPPVQPGYGQGNFSGTRTSGFAIWSLVLGILAFITFGLTAIPAVICGHLALKKIKRSAGAQTGGGLAIAGLVIGYLMLGIVLLLAGTTAPMVNRQRKKADQTEAVNNAGKIGLALMEFENEYITFPNDATATEITKATGKSVKAGATSNARFRQLFVSGMTQSEAMFYVKAKGVHKPDNRIDGEYLLEKGECGFAYVGNLETTDHVARPIAMAPFLPGTQRFDPDPFDGKAVILWTDGSVTSLPIERSSGQVMLEGRNLLDPSHPIWAGKPPVIAWPE